MSQPQRPRLSSEEAAIVRLMSGGRLSRRSMLSGAGALGAGAFLTACGTTAPSGSGGTSVLKPTAAADKSTTDKTVNWANWAEYLDYDEQTKSYPSLADFSKATGIKANYYEEVEDNASYYAQVQGQLHQGKDIQRDVIVLTDWMTTRMIREGLVQKLDKTQVPNAKNILPSLAKVAFDPGREYSLTWQTGYTGIGYNKAELAKLGIPEPKQIADLWDPRLKNRVVVLSEMHDTIGMILLQMGKKPESFTADDFNNALSVMEKQLNSGQIRQVAGQSYVEQMVGKDALAAICWSGDMAQANTDYRAKHPNTKEDIFAFLIAEEGGMLWSDNLMIPIGSPHKQNAEILMNYYYDPKVAAKVAAYVNYVCPVNGAREEIAKLPDVDKALVDSPLIFPDAKYLEQVHMIRTLTQAEETEFTANFQKVLGL